MRIIHVVHSYFPRIGGIERAVQYLAEEQAKLGHEVMVITSNVEVASSPKEETINGVNVVRLGSRKLLYNDLTIPNEEPPIEGVDIIHAHSQNSLFSITVSKKLKIKAYGKVVFHLMAIDAFKDHPNIFIRLIAPYYGRRNTRAALEIADLPLVRSIRDLEILRKRYGVEAEYLPDAVPDYYFTAEKSDPDRFREKFGIKQEKFFLFIGRVHKLKGSQILVRALKYVDEDIAAVFIGPDGGYLRKTLNLAEKIDVKRRVYYLGYVDEKTKVEALDSATALVLPSLADHVEVYSIVISEAWAREKPVIASKVGEIPYRVKQGVNGLLVNPSDPRMLAEAMLKLANEEELAEEMGRNGRKEVFSWRKVAKKSIQLYKQILEGEIK
jgi:glycosyltransferase involved in cell wall biosynthesis